MTHKPQSPHPALLGAAHTDLSDYRGLDGRTQRLIARRAEYLGGSMLFYDQPAEIIRGEGAWLFDAEGRRYLDCYNNVQSVGHCNAAVADAMDRQARRLAVHTRYLHPLIVDYAETLAATLPDPLEVCFFVCSGTEANELATRIARTITGKSGVVVMENSYHGNSQLMADLSTAVGARDRRPAHVAAVEPPNMFRDASGLQPQSDRDFTKEFAAAADQLEQAGCGVSAFLCDAIFDSQGGLEAPADYFTNAYKSFRDRGALCIADEVQAGFGRTGRMWGFSHYGVIPDIVTLGKPIGNGYPLGAVVTTKAIARQFMRSEIYFNTFGGNPVAAAAGLAVLQEFESQKLLDHAKETGTYLRARLDQIATEFPVIGNIQGRGLYQGIDIAADVSSGAPGAKFARQVPDLMKDQGVMVGLSGRFGNVIKIRPPLVITKGEVDILTQALKTVLERSLV